MKFIGKEEKSKNKFKKTAGKKGENSVFSYLFYQLFYNECSFFKTLIFGYIIIGIKYENLSEK